MEILIELLVFVIEAAVMGFGMALGASVFERVTREPEPPIVVMPAEDDDDTPQPPARRRRKTGLHRLVGPRWP